MQLFWFLLVVLLWGIAAAAIYLGMPLGGIRGLILILFSWFPLAYGGLILLTHVFGLWLPGVPGWLTYSENAPAF